MATVSPTKTIARWNICTIGNIAIGWVFGMTIFSLVPMFFGAFAAPVVALLHLIFKSTPLWVLSLIYWILFAAFLATVVVTDATWLIDPFRDLDYWRR